MSLQRLASSFGLEKIRPTMCYGNERTVGRAIRHEESKKDGIGWWKKNILLLWIKDKSGKCIFDNLQILRVIIHHWKRINTRAAQKYTTHASRRSFISSKNKESERAENNSSPASCLQQHARLPLGLARRVPLMLPIITAKWTLKHTERSCLCCHI